MKTPKGPRRDDDDDVEFHAIQLPPGLAAHLLGAIGRGEPRSTTFDEMAARIRPGMWGRAIQDDEGITVDGMPYRDGVIVVVPPVGDVLTQPTLAGRLLVVAYDDVAKERVELMLSRETVRALVNALGEAVTESERTDRAAAAANDAVAASRQKEETR